MRHKFLKGPFAVYFRLGVGVLISLLALYLSMRNLSPPDFWPVLSRARVLFLILALLSVAFNTLGKALRWRVLIGPGGRSIAFSKILGSLLAGQLVNAIIPGRVGDLSRVYVVGGRQVERSFVLGTVVLEKLFDTVSYGILFIVLLLLMPLPDWVADSGYTLAAAAVMLGVVLSLMAFQRHQFASLLKRLMGWLPARFRPKMETRLEAGLASLAVLQQPGYLLQIVFWTMLVWVTAILNNHLTLLALGVRLPFTASLLILIALQAGISAASVPGSIGVFEYLCILALSVFGVARGLAFGYGVLLHAIVFLPVVAGGLVALWGLNFQPRAWQEMRTEDQVK